MKSYCIICIIYPIIYKVLDFYYAMINISDFIFIFHINSKLINITHLKNIHFTIFPPIKLLNLYGIDCNTVRTRIGETLKNE